MGGLNHIDYAIFTTQIVRPGQPTEQGPNMTESVAGHCSTTLEDGSVISTGGRRMSQHEGSARTEIYSFNSKKWTTKEDMQQRRFGHTCAQVWLDPKPDPAVNGIIPETVTNSSVLSIVVAGGKLLFLF